jgi:hypothetical protein
MWSSVFWKVMVVRKDEKFPAFMQNEYILLYLLQSFPGT